MTTILEARDALEAALAGAGVAIADAPGMAALPAGVIYGEGIDLGHSGRGQAVATFRVTLMSGAWDQASAGRVLTGMVQTALATIRALDGWALGAVRRDTAINVAGGLALGADVTASCMVDI